MAATYLASSAVSTIIETNSTSWSITGPAGSPATNDWVVVILESVNAATFTPPAGFTADVTAVEGTTDGRGRNFYGKFATVGAGPYTFTPDASRDGCAVVLAVRGADQTTPLNLASTALDQTTSATTWSCTGQTTTAAGCCIVGWGGSSPNNVGRTWAVTGGGTQRAYVQNASSNHVLVVGTLDQSAAGAIAISGTNSNSEPTYSIQMAFAPTSGPPPPVPTLLTIQGALSWG